MSGPTGDFGPLGQSVPSARSRFMRANAASSCAAQSEGQLPSTRQSDRATGAVVIHRGSASGRTAAVSVHAHLHDAVLAPHVARVGPADEIADHAGHVRAARRAVAIAGLTSLRAPVATLGHAVVVPARRATLGTATVPVTTRRGAQRARRGAFVGVSHQAVDLAHRSRSAVAPPHRAVAITGLTGIDDTIATHRQIDAASRHGLTRLVRRASSTIAAAAIVPTLASVAVARPPRHRTCLRRSLRRRRSLRCLRSRRRHAWTNRSWDASIDDESSPQPSKSTPINAIRNMVASDE